MGSDIALVVGMLFGFLSFPALVSAFAGGRPMRTAVSLMVVGGVLMAYAAFTSPSGYRADEIPHVVLRVIAHLTR